MEYILKADELDMDDQPMPQVNEKVKEGLRRSIEKYGIEYPLVVRRKEDGRYAILDGRTRFSIGGELGIKEYRCIVEDTVARPERLLLKYDLELCRRRLQESQAEQLTREKEAYAETLFGNEDLLNSRLERIIPEYRERIKQIYQSDKLEALNVLNNLVDITPENQRLIIINEGNGDESLKMLAQEKESLRVKVEELNEEVVRLRDVEAQLAEKQKQMDTLMKEYKKRFNDELSERQKEIEKSLRELYAEQDVASIAKKIETAVSAERIRLEKEMAKDMEDLNREMREMSLSFKKTNEEIEKKKEELDKVKARLKEAEDLAVKHKNEAMAYKSQLQKMASPKNVELKVKAASDSLSTILEMVQVVQNEMVSCCDILGKNGQEKPKLTPILNEIEKKKGKIEEFLGHIGKAREKIQGMIEN